MTKVFVSYRREDTLAIVGRLGDHLCDEFGSDNVFIDIDNIPYGVDFIEHIESTLNQCDVVLVVIGKHWCGRRTQGKFRLSDENDPVRLELENALSASIEILPILVRGARMPSDVDLPEKMQKLSRLNAAPLDLGRDFNRDTKKIVQVIRDMATKVGFSMSQWSSEIEYKCRRCGYQGWIHKLEWFRDGERPPSKCPQCGGRGYSE